MKTRIWNPKKSFLFCFFLRRPAWWTECCSNGIKVRPFFKTFPKTIIYGFIWVKYAIELVHFSLKRFLVNNKKSVPVKSGIFEILLAPQWFYLDNLGTNPLKNLYKFHLKNRVLISRPRKATCKQPVAFSIFFAFLPCRKIPRRG